MAWVAFFFPFYFIIVFYFYLCSLAFFLHVYLYEGIRYPGTGVIIVSCRVGAWNWTQVHQNSQSAWSLSHLSSLLFFFYSYYVCLCVFECAHHGACVKSKDRCRSQFSVHSVPLKSKPCHQVWQQHIHPLCQLGFLLLWWRLRPKVTWRGQGLYKLFTSRVRGRWGKPRQELKGEWVWR